MNLPYDLDTLMPPRPQRKSNGQFTKGHTPYTKGKKWSEWMPAEMQAKIRAAMPHSGWHQSHSGGMPKKPVMATKDGKSYYFDSLTEAAEKTGANPIAISMACKGKRKHALHYEWKFI